MALIPGGKFNTDNVKEQTIAPAGTYEVMITDSAVKENSKGTGSYLRLTFKIIEGEYKDTPIWTQLNLVNPSAKAVEIAQRELAAICRACGVDEVEDSFELHGIPMLATVTVNPEQDGYAASNGIGKFKAL